MILWFPYSRLLCRRHVRREDFPRKGRVAPVFPGEGLMVVLEGLMGVLAGFMVMLESTNLLETCLLRCRCVVFSLVACLCGRALKLLGPQHWLCPTHVQQQHVVS